MLDRYRDLIGVLQRLRWIAPAPKISAPTLSHRSNPRGPPQAKSTAQEHGIDRVNPIKARRGGGRGII